MNVDDIEKYLVDDIKRSIRNDVFPLVSSTKVPDEGGLFAALREIFAYIDYFGYLLTGKRSSSNGAVMFIRDYLGRVDSKYAEVGGMLYYIYRHGPIHNYQPKSIILGDGSVVAWVVIKSTTPGTNLFVMKKDNTFNVSININALHNDLNVAIDQWIKDIRANSVLQANFNKARNEITIGDTEADVMKRAKKYIDARDFNFIKNTAKLI